MAERSVIRDAPVLFTSAVLLTCGLIYPIVLSVKNDQITFYKEKLGQLPAPRARYSVMRNAELKKSASDFAQRLRDRVAIYKKQAMDASIADLGHSLANGSKMEDAAKGAGVAFGQVMFQSASEYEREYRADAISLRDELQIRLPPNISTADPAIYLSAPGGMLGGEAVANDLDRLARMLP